MKEERIWLLLSLQLSGEATPAELEELSTLLQQYPDEGMKAAILQNIWQQHTQSVRAANRTMSFNKHLQRLSNHLSEPVLQFENSVVESEQDTQPATEAVSHKYRWLWVGSSIAASIIIFFLFFFQDKIKELPPPKLATNTVSTKAGSKSRIQLPDGTQVWLNADSKIEYNETFSGKYREVKLTGEAYFDVVKDKSRPFIIHTNSIQVKVLGTAFNVRSYPNEKTTETALIRGSVEITLNGHADNKIILKPNEKLVVNNNSAVEINTGRDTLKKELNEPIMTLGNVHLDKTEKAVYETMWVKNKLAFENEPFDRIVAEIERWYDVEITVKKESVKTERFRGIFENKTLAEVLEALQISGQFQYQIKDGKVTIW
jgi:transmembrane sensor